MKDIETRMKKLKKYFGILTEEEVNTLISIINEMRKINDERIIKKPNL